MEGDPRSHAAVVPHGPGRALVAGSFARSRTDASRRDRTLSGCWRVQSRVGKVGPRVFHARAVAASRVSCSVGTMGTVRSEASVFTRGIRILRAARSTWDSSS